MFTPEVLNGFRAMNRTAAAEIPAKRPGHRAFVGVYPPVPKTRPDQWLIRRFEIAADLVETDVQEEDLLDSEYVSLDTLPEVERWLRNCKLTDAQFFPVARTAYPL